MPEIIIGDYLNVETCSNEDIAEIIGAHTETELKDNKTGRMKKVINIPVKLNGKRELSYSPNVKILKQFIAKWGKNTDLWIGKKFQTTHKIAEIMGNEQTVLRPTILE